MPTPEQLMINELVLRLEETYQFIPSNPQAKLWLEEVMKIVKEARGLADATSR